MKNKLIGLFLFGWLGCFGQVPNTATFSLQNVVDIVGGTNLTQAFANSVDVLFDPAYKGAKNNLYNFRNYGTYGPPTVTTTDATSIVTVCGTSTTAISGGNVTIRGTDSPMYVGICWSTSPNPTIANSLFERSGVMGAYTTNMTFPWTAENHIIYYRSYARNSSGTGYGAVKTIAPSCLVPSGLTNYNLWYSTNKVGGYCTYLGVSNYLNAKASASANMNVGTVIYFDPIVVGGQPYYYQNVFNDNDGYMTKEAYNVYPKTVYHIVNNVITQVLICP